MNPRSLGNLVPLPAVLDGLESVSVRLRISEADAKALRRLEPAERGRVVVLGLKARELGE